MDSLLDWFQSESMLHLVSALLHSLWQGVIVALLLGGILRFLPARRDGTRYALSLGALGALVLAFMITWGILDIDPPLAGDVPDSVAETGPSGGEAGAPVAESVLSRAVDTAGSARLDEPSSWQSWLAVAWTAGAILMLARAAFLVRGADRLKNSCRPLEVGEVIDTVNELRREMGVRSKIEVLVGESVKVPAVMGVVWPSLLLPAGMVSATSPLTGDQLRMVLAHEIAHIRRYDYLVNLFQLVVESVLFFNPAVWWISSQVRLEREACCDTAAVSSTGRSVDYAQALEDIALSLRAGSTALGAPALATRGRGSLLARVQRILRPGHRPEIRIPWLNALLVLAASGAFLVALRLSTATVVQEVADLLTPRQRIDAISEIARTHRQVEDEDYAKLPKVRVSGTIVTADGQPLPDTRAHARAHTERQRASISHSLRIEGNRFSGEVTPGQISLSVDIEGYAPQFLGPFEKRPGETLDDLQVTLSRGFPARIRVVDDEGNGIEAAHCTGLFKATGINGRQFEQETDSWGDLVIERATGEADLQISVRAEGYQYDGRTVRLAAEATQRIELQAARPTIGRVLSEDSGEAVAGARVAIARRNGFDNFTRDPRDEWARRAGPVWTTDEQGRFVLASLRDDCVYDLHVDAPAHGGRIVRGVRAGQQDIEVRLGRPLEIQGAVIGKLEKLPWYGRGKPRVYYSNPVMLGDTSFSTTFHAPVTIEGDRGHFRITDLLPGRVRIHFPGKSISMDVQEPVDDLVVDLRSPAEGGDAARSPTETRRVVVRVLPPSGSPVPEGELRVDYVEPGAPGYKPFWLPLEDGRVEIDVPLPDGRPGKFRYGPIFSEGYWLADRSGIPVPRGEGPLVLEVEAHPAGAVYGEVLDAAGRATTEFHLTVLAVDRPETPDGAWPRNHDGRRDDSTDGKFLLDAIPLGGVYRVVASDSRVGHHGRVMSAPLEIDASNPIQEITLQIPRGVDLPVVVLDDAGEPVSGVPIELDYKTPYSHSFGGTEVRTGRDGRHVFEGVNPDVPGEYRLDVGPHGPYRGQSLALRVDGNLHTIELERGLIARGTVVNDATGEPLPHAVIELHPVSSEIEYRGTVEGHADTRGRFEIHGLESGRYQVRVEGTRPAGTTVRIDEQGRKWYTSGDDGQRYLEVTSSDVEPGREIRVMLQDDPRLHPER